MADKKRFTATGAVWGNCWGGGKCGYKAKAIIADTMEELEKTAREKLEDGSLDDGMGFESLYGATLNVKIETIKEIDGEEFIHTEYEPLFIGETTEAEEEVFYNM